MSEANNGAQKIRVGVFGAGGRMGATVCDAVMADPDLELVAAVDPACAGQVIHGITIGADPRAMADAGVQVAVDFTIAAASRTNLQWCALHGVHAVVGTTGFNDEDLNGFRSAFTSSNCMIAANFAISAVLMMKFAEMASPWLRPQKLLSCITTTKPMHQVERQLLRQIAWQQLLASGPLIRQRMKSSLVHVAARAQLIFVCTRYVCAAWLHIKK